MALVWLVASIVIGVILATVVEGHGTIIAAFMSVFVGMIGAVIQVLLILFAGAADGSILDRVIHSMVVALITSVTCIGVLILSSSESSGEAELWTLVIVAPIAFLIAAGASWCAAGVSA